MKQRLPDDTGLLAPGGDQYLGDPHVVETVVRDFLATAVFGRSDMNERKISPDAYRQRLEDKGEQVQRIFYGQEPGYEAMPWNRPDQLGRYLVNLGLGGDPKDAVERLMVHLYREFMPNLLEYEKEKLSDGMMQAVTDETIIKYTRHLMGEPYDAEDQDDD